MYDQSGFRALFESALQTYQQTTGIKLAEHPLAVQFQSCPSTESIIALVEDQVSAFDEFKGKDGIMISIKSTTSILNKLSATISLGGLVRHKGTDGVFHI